MPLSSSTLALTLRPATENDIPLVRDLAERIWRTSYAAMILPAQIDYMLGWMYSSEQIAREIRGGGVWEIAFAEDEAVGFLAMSFEDPARAKLDKIYVLPERQGAGFGQFLLERVHAIAAARGASDVWLQVNKRNPRAIRAYERAGYVVERSTVFEIGQGFVMDDFIMHRPLISRPPA